MQLFHDRHARQPAELDEVKEMHHDIMDEFEAHLRANNVCVDLEYVGSGYDGAQVRQIRRRKDCREGESPKLPLEFDVLVILSGGDLLESEERKIAAGCYSLQVKESFVN